MKIWFIHTTEFYSTAKKNEILKFVGKWMELEIITLHEIFQSKEENAAVLPCM